MLLEKFYRAHTSLIYASVKYKLSCTVAMYKGYNLRINKLVVEINISSTYVVATE